MDDDDVTVLDPGAKTPADGSGTSDIASPDMAPAPASGGQDSSAPKTPCPPAPGAAAGSGAPPAGGQGTAA